MLGTHDMRFSRGAALVIGMLAPILETVRRWNTWRLDPPALFDDYLIGILLLGGFWIYRADRPRGRVLLAAGWGFTCAMAYVSVFSQIAAIRAGTPDPAPVPSEWVLIVKVFGGAIAAIGLALTVFSKDGRPSVSHNG
jgi:hypothetical protein